MSQTTTTPAETMRFVLVDAPIPEEDRQALVLAAERGLLDPRTVEVAQLLDYDGRQEILATTGAGMAWEADQEARAVPLECPSWCADKHGRIIRDGQLTDEMDTLLRPFTQIDSHECALAECGTCQSTWCGNKRTRKPRCRRSRSLS